MNGIVKNLSLKCRISSIRIKNDKTLKRKKNLKNEMKRYFLTFVC